MNNETQTQAHEQPSTILVAGSRHYRLDVQGKRITFLDQRFYFDENGKAVPSVTTILEAYPKGAAFYQWLKHNAHDSDEIRDEAGRRGSRVHKMTEDYDKGAEVTLLNDAGEIGMGVLEWSMFERYVQFRNTNPLFTVQDVEQNYVSGELGYGGTVDRVFVYNGKRYLIDIKTSSSVHAHYWLQLAAYKKMVNDKALDRFNLAQNKEDQDKIKGEFVDFVGVMWLNAKTRTDKGMTSTDAATNCQGKGWQLILREPSEEIRDFDRFKATQKLWLAENADAAPREISYKIAHKWEPQSNMSDEQRMEAKANGTGAGKRKPL